MLLLLLQWHSHCIVTLLLPERRSGILGHNTLLLYMVALLKVLKRAYCRLKISVLRKQTCRSSTGKSIVTLTSHEMLECWLRLYLVLVRFAGRLGCAWGDTTWWEFHVIQYGARVLLRWTVEGLRVMEKSHGIHSFGSTNISFVFNDFVGGLIVSGSQGPLLGSSCSAWSIRLILCSKHRFRYCSYCAL